MLLSCAKVLITLSENKVTALGQGANLSAKGKHDCRREGLVLSYAREKCGEPGRYKTYDLSHVYRIIRAK